MEIRPAQTSDQASIEAVVAAAFDEAADGRVVRMVQALNASRATRISLVALDGELVGHVQLSRAWIDARRRCVDALMLTPLSVAPRWQRRGIGSRLLGAAITTADAAGFAAVFLEGSPTFYGPRGFVAGTSVGFERPSRRIPEPGFQVATLSRYEKWMTGPVVFPDAMWETDTVGLRDPQLLTIEKELSSRAASFAGRLQSAHTLRADSTDRDRVDTTP